MDAPWFPEPPADTQISQFQKQALVSFRHLLNHCAPVRTEPQLTIARIDEGGFLYMGVRHNHENFEVALYVNDLQVVAAWGDVAHEELTMADYHSGVEALRGALDFVRHILLGRFETETIYHGGRPERVTNYIVHDDGSRSPVGATGSPFRNPFVKRRAQVKRISFVD